MPLDIFLPVYQEPGNTGKFNDLIKFPVDLFFLHAHDMGRSDRYFPTGQLAMKTRAHFQQAGPILPLPEILPVVGNVILE